MFTVPNPFYMPYPGSSPMMLSLHHQPYLNGTYTSAQQQSASQLGVNGTIPIETVHLYVPNTMIGCIIGAKGLFIKSIIRNSNASVKVCIYDLFIDKDFLINRLIFQVTPINPDEDQSKIIDREIVISGTPEAQWKSQYYIYEKLRQEGQ